MATPLCSRLLIKYERIRTLRIAHLRASESDSSFIEPDPRAEMASLADEFPGALRELDRLTMEEIDRRVAALRAAEEDPTRVDGWMLAQHEFHRYARGALATKRWLSTQATTPTSELEAAFRAALPALREEAALFATSLDEIAAPLRGRVMDIVYARVAGELGITERELRALLHG
jgi:hypothetical protein